MPRIYLDNAATSWPKPTAVYEAVDRYQREIGAAAGRGAYPAAEAAGGVIKNVRRGIADLIGAQEPSRVILTPGGTESLNLAIHGLVRPGDHVVTTVAEHNSVLRPLAWLRDHAGVRVTHVGCDREGYVSPDDIEAAITDRVRLVAVTHASNVTGALQPIHEIAERCRARGVRLLVDAAQTVGAAPLDVAKTPIDLLAAPGHKQLLGPFGTGFLWIAPGVEEQLRPLMQGGTGTRSESDRQPETLPDRYEPGNLNTPALAGLGAAIEVLAGDGWRAREPERAAMLDRLINGLDTIDGVQLIGPPAKAPRVEVVSIRIHGYDPHEAAAALRMGGVECRAGLHCAGRIHEAVGTASSGGAVRFSPGWKTSPEDIEAALGAVRSLAENAPQR